MKIAIIYHSGYGHTAKVANSIGQGVKDQGYHVDIIKADTISEAEWQILDDASAIIFGAPTYMGSVSGPFKMFMDATSRKWATQSWKNKIAAGFTNSGALSGDKLASLQQIFHLAMQHGMIWIGQTETAPNLGDNEQVKDTDVNRLGSWSGLMTQANSKSGPDIAPPAGDLKTAVLFGKRIAEITSQFKHS